MNLEIKKNSEHSLAVLKESGTASLSQVFPLVMAWIISLVGPVFLMGIGCIVGLAIDKMIFHLKDAGPASLVGLVIPGCLIGGFYAGWIYITLRVARKEPVHLSYLFRPIPQMLTAALVLCLSTLAVGIPSALIIVSPFLFLKFQLAPYFVVDQNYGPIQAMKRSWTETNRIFIPLAIMDLAFGLLSTVLSFTLVVPFVCFLVQSVATAIVYSRWIVNDELDEIAMADDDDDDED